MQRSLHMFQPTYVGFVTNTFDAVLLFEACMQGRLPRLLCRPPRSRLGMDVRSGHIFVFEEHESGIKRWTDSIKWSPSRVLDAFILYRELDNEQIGAGERKRLIPSEERALDHEVATESNLYGSLIDSYPFKADGLMKKTISMKMEEQYWRLVSYYRPEDVRLGNVRSPSEDPGLQSIPPIPDVRQALQCQNDLDSAMVSHSTYPVWTYRAESLVAFPHNDTGAMAYRNDHVQQSNVQMPWYSGQIGVE